MLNNLKFHKVLWVTLGLFAVGVSFVGIVTKAEIYNSLVEERLIPGTYGQDIISLVAGVLLIVFAFLAKDKQIKLQVVILGLLGYFFYAYGIYVIERVYNSLHLWYMAIFTLSFWYGYNKKRITFQRITA
jgi:hypothetical protein